MFPASCPYVTAVGGTNLFNGAEEAAATDSGSPITSGGGFSTYYLQPEWQQEAVRKYLSLQQPAPGYNGQGRGYPDVSLVAVDFEIVLDGQINHVAGTSASTPTFAALGESLIYASQ
jgi:tripeptidyl-peptidase-1